MRIHFKQCYFFISAIFCIPFLFFWIIFFIRELILPLNYIVTNTTFLNDLFNGKLTIIPYVYGLPFLVITPIIYLVNYHREVALWIKLIFMLASVIAVFYFLFDRIIIWFFQVNLDFIGYGSAFMISAVPLTAIIGLIIAMVKYPKKPAKSE